MYGQVPLVVLGFDESQIGFWSLHENSPEIQVVVRVLPLEQSDQLSQDHYSDQ